MGDIPEYVPPVMAVAPNGISQRFVDFDSYRDPDDFEDEPNDQSNFTFVNNKFANLSLNDKVRQSQIEPPSKPST